MNESKLKLSRRASETPPSPIRKLAPLSREAAARGREVLYLNIGQPDLETPQEFFDGLATYNQKVVAYDLSEGNANLRTAWSRYMERTINIEVSPEHFLITTGASEALVFAFMTCCDPGDEILIFDPTYANYMGFAAISGVELVPVVTDLENDFSLPDTAEIYHRISHRTKAILLCHPNNPTGTVYTREELQLLLDIAEERDLFLIADETYRELIFDNREIVSVLHLAPDSDRVIVVDSLSKRFSLCGARIGALITTNDDYRLKALNIAQARLASPSIEQVACAYMLDNISDDYLQHVTTEYQARRDVLYTSLDNIPGVKVSRAGGAFYTVAELPIDDAEAFAAFMLRDFHLDNRTIFMAPAGGFYINQSRGKQSVRLAYVLEQDKLKLAGPIIAAGIGAYNATK